MAITLSRLCANTEKIYTMKLIAGASGMDNFVRWVQAVEDREEPMFLHGNELIFTTGIAQDGNNWLYEFVANLCQRKAAGLVINLGPYISSVPLQVIDFCELNNLPLFTVPWAVHLIDITYDFCQRIVASEEAEARLVTALKNLIAEPDDEKAYLSTLERSGYLAGASYSVVALRPDAQADGIDENDMRSLNLQAYRLLNKTGKLFSLFFQDENLIAVLQDFGGSQTSQFIEALQHNFTVQHANYKMPAGVSTTGEGYPFISDGYKKAISALKVADARQERCVFYQNLDIYKLLISVGSTQVLQEMYQGSLGPLAEFDKANKTDYMDALRCYLEHNSSVQEVAALTFMHRNTINYKIKRIREILKCEFNQENRMKFMLAFYIRDLL